MPVKNREALRHLILTKAPSSYRAPICLAGRLAGKVTAGSTLLGGWGPLPHSTAYILPLYEGNDFTGSHVLTQCFAMTIGFGKILLLSEVSVLDMTQNTEFFPA